MKELSAAEPCFHCMVTSTWKATNQRQGNLRRREDMHSLWRRDGDTKAPILKMTPNCCHMEEDSAVAMHALRDVHLQKDASDLQTTLSWD